MQMRMHLCGLWLVQFVLLGSLTTAGAYYDSSVQRWLNRDPINELGFDLHEYPLRARTSYCGHEFAFLLKSSVALIDPFGLKVYAGKGCKGDVARDMMKGLSEKCKKAKDDGCFKCLGDKAPNMNDPCDPNKFGDVVVECEDKTANGCQTTKGKAGTGCGWTEEGANPNYPGKRVVHVCMNQDKSSGCPSTGCILLHEVAHAAGGVGADSGDNRAYKVAEQCACK